MAKFILKSVYALKRIIKDEGITLDELKLAYQELQRLAEQDAPHLDYTVEPIVQTDHNWYRQKPEGANFRIIILFSFTEKEIIIHAILRRNSSTYDRIEALYETWLKNQQNDDQ